MLVDIVGVDQRGGLEGFQQALGQRFDQRLGLAAHVDAVAAAGRWPLFHCSNSGGHRLVEGGELGMAEDGGLDLAGRHLRAGCSRAGPPGSKSAARTLGKTCQ